MLFPPPNKLPPPTPDKEKVRPRRRCMPAITATVPREPTLAWHSVPAPTPGKDNDCEKVGSISKFGCPTIRTGVCREVCCAAHRVVGYISDRGHVRVGEVVERRARMEQWLVLRDYFGDR
jgi:hypothetical protein